MKKKGKVASSKMRSRSVLIRSHSQVPHPKVPPKKPAGFFVYFAIVFGIFIVLASHLYGGMMHIVKQDKLYFCLLILGAGLFYLGLFSLMEQPYRSVWAYLKESRRYIYFVLGIFVFGILIGFIFYSQFTFLDALLRSLVQKTIGLNALELMEFILFNNMQVAFLGLFLGIFLGIFSLFNALSNGVVLGYVFKRAWDITGISDFWRVLPHGIFELPAIFISLGLGVRLGMFMFAKGSRDELRKNFVQSLLVFLFLIIPLLLLASLIESLLGWTAPLLADTKISS
jgi:stage II sporulation protein M